MSGTKPEQEVPEFGREQVMLSIAAGLIAAAVCVSAYAALFPPGDVGPGIVLLVGFPILISPLVYHLGFQIIRSKYKAIRRTRNLQAELVHEMELRRQAEQALAEIREKDEASGLSTRAHFMSRAGLALARGRRTGNPLVICLMGIDGYQRLLKGLGQDTCNQIAARMGEICQQTLREVDVATRLDDDVFALLLEDTDNEDASGMMKRLRKAIRDTRSWSDGRLVKVTAGFGQVELNPNFHDLEDGLDWARNALDHARSTGPNQICVARDADPRRLKVA